MTEPVTDLLSSVHLVGIGGAGMSALARVLLARGATVSAAIRTTVHSSASS